MSPRAHSQRGLPLLVFTRQRRQATQQREVSKMFLKYQVALQNFATEMVQRFEEARKEERGQTFVEWLGVMALIVVLVVALQPQMSGIASKVVGVVNAALAKIQGFIG